MDARKLLDRYQVTTDGCQDNTRSLPPTAATNTRLHCSEIKADGKKIKSKSGCRSSLNCAMAAVDQQKALHFIVIGRRDVFCRGRCLKKQTHFVIAAERSSADNSSISCPELNMSCKKERATTDGQDDSKNRKCIAQNCWSFTEIKRRLKQWFRDAFDVTVLKKPGFQLLLLAQSATISKLRYSICVYS